MGPKSTEPRRTDAEIARIASRQHGVVSRAQLLAAGVGPRAIKYRCAHGRLHRLHRGVYGVGFASRAPLSRAMAAVLACGPRAVVSHRSAAALWEIGAWTGPIEISAPTKHVRSGVAGHEARLARRDVTTHLRIPVTTPARTLVDLADVLDDRALTRAANQAQVLRLVTAQQLTDQVAAATARRARTRLKLSGDNAPTRSALEDRFLELVRRHDLPRPEVNQRVHGYEVDALWRRPRVIVELDGRAYHDHPDAFERDRARDARLQGAGFHVIRITWRRLTANPAAEAATLRALLQGPFQPKS